MKSASILMLCSLLALHGVAADADVWDVQTVNDNTNASHNELIHGSDQVHDLGGQPGNIADQDWYRMTVPARASMEIVLDGTSGDFNNTFDQLQLDLLDSGSGSIARNHTCIGAGCHSKRLTVVNTTNSPVLYHVRVSGAGCAHFCGADDTYAIRARETTIAVARFNNSGAQLTVLMTQNASDVAINASVFFWNASGTLLATQSLSPLQPKTLSVLSLPSVSGLASQSGSITIAHDGPIGGLNVKAVALEPSTGFSFDTPGVTRPY